MFLNLLSAFRPDFCDDELALVLAPDSEVDPALGISDSYVFSIYLRGTKRKIGYVSLRIGESAAMYYLGHIGYRIEAAYRGHGYAARACRLILPLAQQLGLHSLCITANPDNAASRKTCEHLGCELESIVPIPTAFHSLFPEATQKCRYILPISAAFGKPKIP